MLTKRTNILFDQQTWNMLKQLSASREVSIGQLVRKAVSKLYSPVSDASNRQKLINSIKANRKLIKNPKKPIDYKALINYGRKY